VLVSGDRLYIADTGNTRVVVTDLDGNFLQQIGSKGNAAGQLQEPIGLGVDAQNRLYVGDTWNARIQLFQITPESGLDAAPTGSFNVSGWAANTYNDPYIAVAPDGQVWASQGGRDTVAQFDIAHEYVRRLKGEPGFQAPKGLALSPAGDLYVANSRQGAVVAVRTP
jgi:DNA-binding beta-propeller fold protein YncE